jgi:cell division protease FtsH
MVTKWGLSDNLGPLTYSEEEGEVFLGHSVAQHKNVSDETAKQIDQEVRTIVDRNYSRAQKIIEDHMKELHMMSDALMKYETIDKDQIDDIMAGNEPKPPQDWTETPPTGTSPSNDTTAKSKDNVDKSDGKIGGPAGEH